MSTCPSTPCRHSDSQIQKFEFQKKCLFAITFHEWTWLLFFYKQGLVSTNFISDFLVFHFSSSSTFSYSKSYHHSAEINIESNQIISGLILYHYLNKIPVLFRVIDFFVFNRARKGVIVAWKINRVNLLPVKSSISTHRIVNLEWCTSWP